RRGFAHSAECWRDGVLAGGVYGLACGGTFCGESTFSRAAGASKIALVHLVAPLWRGGFTLFDPQFANPPLGQFGVREVPRDDYRARLARALAIPADFNAAGAETPPDTVAAYLRHLESGQS